MAQKYRVDEIGKALEDAIMDYRKGAGAAIKRAVTQTMEESAAVIKESVTFRRRTGDYVKSFAVKTLHEDVMNKRMVWYAKSPQHRLTHLLENGHRVRDRNGSTHGNTNTYEHISKGNEYAARRLPELAEKELNAL